MANRSWLSAFVVALSLVSGTAMADHHYGMAGCGLGSLIIKGSNSYEQIFVGTTNNWTGTNTSGITSGTSNCRDGSKTTANLFYEINKEALKRDIARGNGETIVSLAQILGCENSAVLASSLQKNFAQVFTADSKAGAFMDKVEPLIRNNSAIQCRTI